MQIFENGIAKYFCIFVTLHWISIGNQTVVNIQKEIWQAPTPRKPQSILNHKGTIQEELVASHCFLRND